MEKKDNKVRGDIVYNFVKDYNEDVRCYNRRHYDNVEELDWDETVESLNGMTDEQQTRYEAAFREAQKQYVVILRKLVFPILEEVLDVQDFSDMWAVEL